MTDAPPAPALKEKPDTTQSLTTEVYSGDARNTGQIHEPHVKI